MAAKKDCLDSDTLPLWLCMIGSEAVCGGLIERERERDVDQTEVLYLLTWTSRNSQSGQRRPVENLS